MHMLNAYSVTNEEHLIRKCIQEAEKCQDECILKKIVWG